MKKAIVFAAVTVAAVAGIYLTTAHRYQTHFMPNSTLNGVDVAGMTVEEAVIEASTTDYDTIKISGRGITDEIKLKDVDFSVSVDKDDITSIVSGQETLKWGINRKEKHTYKAKLIPSFDQNLVHSAIEKSKFVTDPSVAMPENACIHVGETAYEIEKEKEGNAIDVDKVTEIVCQGIEDMKPEISLDDQDCYLKPQVKSTDKNLRARLKAMTDVVDRTIEINMVGAEETVTPEMLFAWSEYDGNYVTINEEKVNEYIDDLIDRYTTYGRERTFHTTGGQEIRVGGGDQDCYGFLFMEAETKEALQDAILGNYSGKLECVWENTGFDRGTKNDDIGYTYVEVSIPEQHMWYYKNGKCVLDTAVVTGLPTEKRSTPTGVFRIIDKLKDHTMTGSYGSAYANYCMPITWEGVCIHDASWRGEYGGDIYTYNGSHGCINTPYSKVKELFENVEIGTPVVVY